MFILVQFVKVCSRIFPIWRSTNWGNTVNTQFKINFETHVPIEKDISVSEDHENQECWLFQSYLCSICVLPFKSEKKWIHILQSSIHNIFKLHLFRRTKNKTKRRENFVNSLSSQTNHLCVKLASHNKTFSKEFCWNLL